VIAQAPPEQNIFDPNDGGQSPSQVDPMEKKATDNQIELASLRESEQKPPSEDPFAEEDRMELEAQKDQPVIELSDDIGFDDEVDHPDPDAVEHKPSLNSNFELVQPISEVDSVAALTLKHGVDYEDNHQTAFNEDPQPKRFRTGFGSEDDLNGDGMIDNLEQQIKVMHLKDEINNKFDEKIKDDYLKKFRKEVDFHHKVAYRFEKAYRLGKKMSSKKQALNLEIIEIISEHSDYIEQDPMALFYCLYFCIYYNNPDLVEFMRTLIKKMDNATKPDKIDQMLEYIDVNGIDVLRTLGEQINTHVYHIVFYQAIDDELRVVFA